MENQIISINLVPNLSTPAVVRVSQYDVGRPLVFKVYDGTSPADLTGVTAVIEGTKRSGLGFSESGTVSNNTVTLDTTLAMTQEDGSIPAEIRFSKTGEDVGTANFILSVEPSPHLEGTTDGTTETMADLQSQLDALDTRVDALEAGGSGLSQTEKNLILTLFGKAAYAESDAETAYDALEALWTSSTKTITYTLSHVTSSNTATSIESGQSYTTTLTASTDYTINSVTVTMGGVDVTSTTYSNGTVSIPSVTGNIVITATAVLAVQSITATYTQGGTVYDTDSLDSLKADLVVTANYSGGTSETVPSSDYTLSGTLTVGTSTITVSYAGLTDTFSVTVTRVPNYVRDGLQGYWTFENVAADYLGDLTNLADNGDLKAQALYAHNYSSGTPFNHVIDGEFLSTYYYLGGVAPNHCPTAIRISKESTHPQFYTTYPYSVEWYGKFVGDQYDGTTFRRAFSYATAATEPFLINTRNNADPDTSLFSNGGTGTIVTVQSGSYVSYGAVGQGNNTIADASMTPESYHHYVITVAQTSMKIYVDGTLVGEGTATNNSSASASQGLLVGMNTLIKFVRVYNKILSAQEVATNYSDVA